MFAWLRKRRSSAARVDDDATALVREFGGSAYGAARRREREASAPEFAKHWRMVSLAVARKTGKRVGLDTATRMLNDAEDTAKAPGDITELDEQTRIILGE